MNDQYDYHSARDCMEAPAVPAIQESCALPTQEGFVLYHLKSLSPYSQNSYIWCDNYKFQYLIPSLLYFVVVVELQDECRGGAKIRYILPPHERSGSFKFQPYM